MVSGDQLQQILNDPLGYAVAYRYIVICAALLVAAVLAIALGTGRKPKKPATRPALHFPEAVAEQSVAPAAKPNAAISGLPLPQPQDQDYARRVLGVTEVSAQQGWKLYEDGIQKNDLTMAMTGLRFLAQYISEGGSKSYTSPWWEYKTLAQSYLALARAHNSRSCLELARDAFTACDAAIAPEPSTERPAREVLQNLQLLNQELAARPGA